jgi:2-keto-4-pentenoate hydratase
MPNAAVESAARFLLAARQSRQPGGRLPDACRPADTDTALAIQMRVTASLGLPIGGWKCSVPTAERPKIVAPIFAPTVRRDSPCPIMLDHAAAKVEPEVAFVLGRPLPARGRPYSEDEIRAAIGETRLVLELIGPRYADPASAGFPELLADSIANQGLFVGPLLERGLERRLESMQITIDTPAGRLLARDGKHPDGHPLRPLYWLANFLAGGGYAGVDGLAAGQVVTTGSYCGVLEVPVDTALDIRYGELGTLSVRFSTLG